MQTDFVHHLLKRDLTELQARRWLVFVRVALCLLYEAARALSEPLRWEVLLQKVGTRMVQEPDITTELYDVMQELQKRSEVMSPWRDVHVKCEDPVSADSRAGKSSKAADFVLLTLRFEGVLRFVIESKLLREQSDLITSYLGKDGLGCFTTTDSPYSREVLAGMVGYTRTGSEPDWNTALQRALDARVPRPIIAHGKVGVIEGEPDLHYSDVDRGELQLAPLFLLHRIFLFPGCGQPRGH